VCARAPQQAVGVQPASVSGAASAVIIFKNGDGHEAWESGS
jgi:hypothetical protein